MRDWVSFVIIFVLVYALGHFMGWSTTREDWKEYILCVESAHERNCEAIYDAPIVDY